MKTESSVRSSLRKETSITEYNGLGKEQDQTRLRGRTSGKGALECLEQKDSNHEVRTTMYIHANTSPFPVIKQLQPNQWKRSVNLSGQNFFN